MAKLERHSQETIDKIKDLAMNKGRSMAQIGKALGLTKGQVAGIMYRNKISLAACDIDNAGSGAAGGRRRKPV